MELQKQIDKIKDGYTVIDDEEDGHDKCGSLYWVWCRNGWSGRSWELNSNLKTDIKNAKNEYYKNKYGKYKGNNSNNNNNNNTKINNSLCKFNKAEPDEN